MSDRGLTIPPELADWAARVAPLELIERRLHIADKAEALVGILDGTVEEWLDRCDRAVNEARARLGLDGASAVDVSTPSDHRATVPPVAMPDLARSAHILADFARALHGRGVAGEDRFAKVVYLCVTSRVLERPVSVAAKGPSSAGKSYVVERVLDFFPESAYYALSAMSEHALAYSQEPLAHRMLVLYEAVGLESDFASYLVRSLLSEGCIRYETVEKQKGAGMVPKLIVREGPTGLIVTTTAVSLHPENETRLLSVPANDTREQTALVLRMLAAEGKSTGEADLEPWRDLQAWVAAQDNRVTLPFALTLAEFIPPVAVRLRRDFTTVLSLVRAHAILHQATRERDAEGRIVATLADYGAVRELVADLVADEVEATVPATVSEAVAAVAALHAETEKPVTYQHLAEALGLDKSAARRRAKIAITRGYLKNLETKRGQPARLVPGEPLPADLEILPTPETLAGAGGTVARPFGGTETAASRVAAGQDRGMGTCHAGEASHEAEDGGGGTVARLAAGRKATADDEVPDDDGLPDDDRDEDRAIPFARGSTLERAARIVVDVGAASRVLLERRLDLYEAEACQVLDHLEALGIIGSGNGAARSVLVDDEGLDRLLESQHIERGEP